MRCIFSHGFYSIDDIQYPKPIREKEKNHANDSPKPQEECNWGNFAKGAVYALQSKGNSLSQVGIFPSVLYSHIHC